MRPGDSDLEAEITHLFDAAAVDARGSRAVPATGKEASVGSWLAGTLAPE
jgi:hypothetical protein